MEAGSTAPERGRAAYTAIGVVLTVLVVTLKPERLADLDRVYVEDETEEPVHATVLPVA